jgi:MFS family permease
MREQSVKSRGGVGDALISSGLGGQWRCVALAPIGSDTKRLYLVLPSAHIRRPVRYHVSGTRNRTFYGCWVVVVAGVGLFFSAAPVVVYSFSVFLTSISQEFHSGRGAISLAFTLHNLCSAVVLPFLGRLADRFGARRVVLPALAGVGLTLLSAKWIGSSIWQFYLFFIVLGILGPATVAVPYGTAISRWFDRYRGLALSLMMLGLGTAAIVVPPISQRLIALYGWRSAYAIFGCATLLIPIPVVGLFLKQDPRQEGLFPDGIPPADTNEPADRPIEGLAWNQIWRTGTFWLMICALFLAGASSHGCVLHLAAMLSDRGVSAQAAANATSIIGIAMLCGRSGSGYFLDRFFAPRVAAVIFGQSALGIAFLAAGAAGSAGIFAAFMVGLAFGAEVEVMGYLVSRYFGLRSLGTTFGACFASFVLAGAAGAYIMGAGYDRAHSYTAPLLLLFFLMSLAAFLFTRLGPYRFAARSSPEQPALTPVTEAIS